MLARLQQVTTLSLLLATLGWLGWFLAVDGRTLLAVSGAFFILFGYAVFLAMEFVFVARVHGSDPAPRARPAQLLRAWLGEVWSAPQVFCWRQPFRADAEPDHLPARTGRRGVVFVHGFVCNRGLWNPWLQDLRQDGVPFVAVNLEPVFGSIDAYPPLLEAAARKIEAATGRAPVIVAHSMGGLAVRAWLDAFAAAPRVHRVLTIGTPHHGTWLARFAFVPNARQMRLGNPWLKSLADREPAALGRQFTCFFSHCDNIVFPASTATFTGADNVHVDGTAHVHMVSHPRVRSELNRWLAD